VSQTKPIGEEPRAVAPGAVGGTAEERGARPAWLAPLAREVAAADAVVVIASSDDIELCDTCDRVLVMRNGQIVAEVTGDRLTPEELGRLQLEVARH
jgi:hypothetical protein